MLEIEDDGFITVYGGPTATSARTSVPIDQRCADCHQAIAPDGSGHLSWCPFDGYKEFPRLLTSGIATSPAGGKPGRKQNRSTAVMQRRVESRQSLDDFPTPPWATRALIEEVIGPRCRMASAAHVELRAQNVWEPACGRGHMAAALAEYFFSVHASDVADYSAEEHRTPVYRGPMCVSDFLDLDAMPPRIETMGVDWIITNPPFRRAPEFIRRALTLRPRKGVAMLTRLAFLEGVARHRDLFRPAPPHVIAQFVERVPMVKGRLTAKGSTATAYCWLVWLSDACDIGVTPTFEWIPPCRKRLECERDYLETRDDAR